MVKDQSQRTRQKPKENEADLR